MAGENTPPTPPTAPAGSAADLANPNRSPTVSDLAKLNYQSTTTSVATPEEITALGVLFTSAGVDPNSVPLAMWDLARAYADVQSSRSAMLVGSTPSNKSITRQTLARKLDQVNITPRQFCMYFAKVVWNILISSNTAPAGWAKLGYPEECKFAAFDFFDGVLSPAALDPADGLIRQPNTREIQAHSTAKFGALARQRISNGNFVSTLAEVTHGRVGGVNAMYSIEAPPEA
ncbi:coat protein [Potexvirus ecsalstroemeriae]|uniref:Coat protein n=1 Tax=Potexvirus ecsalstroemeriae TaxID=316983 RepID=Q3V6G3_9VIRU|nr:coat protein [Alstroemeria virus X]BAE44215.1 coat protein [Alstroemeria virus X]